MSSDEPLGERLRTPAAARYLGIGKSTLDRMRCQGTGPVFERVGPRVVVYSVAALDDYLARRRATSTSDLPPSRPEPTLAKANGAPAGAALPEPVIAPPPVPASQKRRRSRGPRPPGAQPRRSSPGAIARPPPPTS